MHADNNHKLVAQNGQTLANMSMDEFRRLPAVEQDRVLDELLQSQSPSFIDFWSGQISQFHHNLKKVMTNLTIRGEK